MATRKTLIDLLNNPRITVPNEHVVWTQCVALIVGAEKRLLDSLITMPSRGSGAPPSDDSVLEVVISEPGKHAGEIAATVCADTKVVSYILRRLEATGRITVTGKHRGKQYHPATPAHPAAPATP